MLVEECPVLEKEHTEATRKRPYSDKQKQQAAEYYLKNKEKKLEQGRIWRSKNPGKAKEYNLRHRTKNSLYIQKKRLETRYGLTEEGRIKMEADQGGTCGLCGLPFPNRERNRFHIDHIHGSSPVVVRSLLCVNCNHGLGKFKDDPNLLRIAASYLEKHGYNSRYV